MKPLLKVPRYKTEPSEPIYLGDGINQYGTPFIKQSYARDSRNTSTRSYPALSVRPGTASAFSAITTPNALGQRDNTYPHVLDGTTWKRWSGTAWTNVQTSLANAAGKFIEFATGTTLYTILADGTNKYSWDGSSAASITDMPATNLIASHAGRVYALLGKVLSFSALNLITDWTTALDAGSISVTRAQGDGTAITEFDDQIYVWSAQSFHTLYGTGPLNYSLSDISNDGCISDRSVIESKHNNSKALYWMDYGWIKVFTGSTPQKEGHAVKTFLDGINLTYKAKICAGKNGKYLYWAIPYGTSTANNIVLEYDTEFKIWNAYDRAIASFVNIGEYCYGVTPTGTLLDMDSGTTDASTAISWYHTTGAWNRQTLRPKTVNEIPVVLDLPVGSTLTLGISETIDDDDFTTIYTFTASATEQHVVVPVDLDYLQNTDWYRLKFIGTGPCTIYYIGQDIRVEV